MYAYTDSEYTFPRSLTKEEMAYHLNRYNAGDTTAKNTLIEGNLRVVHQIVMRFRTACIHYSFTPEDLFSEGVLGLMSSLDAIVTTDATLCLPIMYKYIYSAIIRFIDKEAKTNTHISLDTIVTYVEDLEDVEPYLFENVDEGDLFDALELKLNLQRLTDGIESQLSPLEKEVLRLRYGIGDINANSQRDTASMLGIPMGYVARLEKLALLKLRKALNNCKQIA